MAKFYVEVSVETEAGLTVGKVKDLVRRSINAQPGVKKATIPYAMKKEGK